MFPRRLLTCLARFVLAWFVLHVGAGIAAPVLQPQAQALQLVCAGTGLKLVGDGGGDVRVVSGTLDCPLCSPALAPPPMPASVPVVHAVPLLSVAQPQPVTLHARPVPPPARGPPASFSA